MTDKKKMQLGMNPSTASHRLVKDVLWKLIKQTGQDSCCKCGEPMTRETFSIEHVIPWLDSENPVELYFNLDNIAFSHLSCNISDARRPHAGKMTHGTTVGYNYHACRCAKCTEANRNHKRERRSSGKR